MVVILNIDNGMFIVYIAIKNLKKIAIYFTKKIQI